jgi:hypothetical protein
LPKAVPLLPWFTIDVVERFDELLLIFATHYDNDIISRDINVSVSFGYSGQICDKTIVKKDPPRIAECGVSGMA